MTTLARKSQPVAVGLVVIGRNEGERLRRSLASVRARFAAAIYIDSGSTDQSVALARSMGLAVHELDCSRPFTAARARNEGFAALLSMHPELEFVQFLDGDCELESAWLAWALRVFAAEPKAAVVCGRRRERAPNASIYNLLCDLEWDTPVGCESDCGGDALVRASAFRAVGGFDPSMIAGEEPDLCCRLRQHDFAVLRIDAAMTVHDASMTRFGQFWKRAVRTGYCAAEGAARLGRRADARHPRHLRHALSALVWAALAPIAVVGALLAPDALVPPAVAVALLGALLLGYAVLFVRVALRRIDRGDSPRASSLYALFCVLGKWPELQGAITYVSNRALRRDARWIEYKDRRELIASAPDDMAAGPRSG